MVNPDLTISAESYNLNIAKVIDRQSAEVRVLVELRLLKG